MPIVVSAAPRKSQPSGRSSSGDVLQHRRLRLDVEIDQHVAQEDHVERRHRRQRRGEVHSAGTTRRGAAPGRPASARRPARSMCTSRVAGRPRLTSTWLYSAGLGPLDHLGGDVGGDDLVRPAGRQELLQRDGQAVRLLPARAGRRPEPDLAVADPGLDQLRQHHVGQRGERLAVAEPRGLVGGQRVDDPALARPGRAAAAASARNSETLAAPTSRATGISRASTRYSLPGASTIAASRRTSARRTRSRPGTGSSGHRRRPGRT